MRSLKSKRKKLPDISRLREYPIQASYAVRKAVPSANEAAALLTAGAVRARCAIVSEAVQRGETRYFRLVPDRLGAAVRRVVEVTRRRYPDLVVPHHSRWRHFVTGGVDRAAIISVLLDAGAGGRWRYRDVETGQVLTRSEGLAVASLRAMQTGLFSADPATPWRADAEALALITPESLARAFQHAAGKELVGLEGRALLLRRLGEVCVRSPTLFGVPARLGRLYDHWSPGDQPLSANEVLGTLVKAFGAIWPGRISLAGVPLGDCGRHPAAPGDGLVPFHKLCQWIAYSLIEPLHAGGLRVVELDGLTGLAEYRNGGLLLDCGVIAPRDPDLLQYPLDALSEPVVEWRALTVTLLDELAVLVDRK